MVYKGFAAERQKKTLAKFLFPRQDGVVGSVGGTREHQEPRCLLLERGLILRDERQRSIHISFDSAASSKALVLCFLVLQLLL